MENTKKKLDKPMLYAWNTPNGYKVTLLLSELDVPYSLVPINLQKEEHKKETFTVLNPNQKIPILVDEVMGKKTVIRESCAIMVYLAEKAGRFLSQDPLYRAKTLEWLFFQASSLGPMMGQAFHFKKTMKDPQSYPVERFMGEVKRLCQVIDRHLKTKTFFMDDHYSIADMAHYPWVRAMKHLNISLEAFPHLHRWKQLIDHRPKTQRGLLVFENASRKKGPDDKKKA